MELSGDRMGRGDLAPVTITWSCVFLDHNVNNIRIKSRKYVGIKNT
jgi:hypothetical protein